MRKLLTLLTVIILLTSCTKEGCINSNADNYDSSADISDNSCVYSADMVLYWSESTSNAFYQELGFYPSFQMYINNEYIGVISMAEYWTTTPDCDNSNALTHSLGLGNNESGSITVEAYYDGQVAGSWVFTVQGGYCNTVNLDD